MRRMKRYDPALREKIIEQYRSGRSQVEICRDYGIPKSTFYNWLGKDTESGSIEADRIARLKQENLQLKILLADNILALLVQQLPKLEDGEPKE